MYRLILRCRRRSKLTYLYLTPIVNDKGVLLSVGVTFNKYNSYEMHSMYEVKGMIEYIAKRRKEITKCVKDIDEYFECITGYEVEEDYGTQNITRLIDFGRF